MVKLGGVKMKILLLSDTHGDLHTTKQILQQHTDVDVKIHLGDVGFPLQELDDCTVVKGNHDSNRYLPQELHLSLENREVLCLHGNLFDDETVQEVLSRKDVAQEDIMDVCTEILHTKLASYAKRKGCDTVFYGHTHHACFLEMDGVLFVNPGSVSFGVSKNTYALVTIHQKEMDVQFYSIENC